MGERALIVFCGLLLAVSAFSVDITLPFFGRISAELQTPYPLVQASVSIYLFGIGIGQILFGPLSDRIGRRPTLAIGLGAYLMGTLIALFATDIGGLLAGRAVQGVGGAAGPVLGRAILRDRYTGQALAQSMAIAMAIFSFGPIVAPLIGVGIAEVGGSWRAVFVAMGLLATALLAALLRVPETLATPEPHATDPSVMLGNARAVIAHPQSRYFLLLAMMAHAGMVSIIVSVPRVYEVQFGITGALFALLFAVHGVGIIVGQVANHRLIGRIGAVPTALLAALLMLATLIAMVALGATGRIGPYSLSALLALFAVGYLIVLSNCSSMALEPHGRIAGFTSSFFGLCTLMFGSVVATVVAAATAGRLVPWALALTGMVVVCVIALRRWTRAH
ncbi:MAG: MFS transporter [Burkholderiales bacterium]|nr:MAG: MFS transporter [Burkholderiales bacterium]